MFPSTAVAPAPALPSLRAALRQAAELTVAFATLESYSLDDVLPARSGALHEVPSLQEQGAAPNATASPAASRDHVASETASPSATREVAVWAAPADDWLAEVRPIGTGGRRRVARDEDDDAAGTAAAPAGRPRDPRRPDAKLAAAAQAGGWPVAGPRLVAADVPAGEGDEPGEVRRSVGWPDAPAPAAPAALRPAAVPRVDLDRRERAAEGRDVGGVTSLAARRAEHPRHAASVRRPRRLPAGQLSLLV